MRLVIAAVVGTIVVFLWGFFAGGGLGLWSSELRDLPEGAEAQITSAIQSNVPSTGSYLFPPRPPVSDGDDGQARQAWQKAAENGPTGILLVRPSGVRPLAAGRLITGLSLQFAGSLLLAVILSIAGSTGIGFGGRLVLGLSMVAFAVIAGVLIPSNQMQLPADWTRSMVGEPAIGWGLAVIAIGIAVRSSRRTGRHHGRP
ncbi:MAG: hypothetical protein CMJ23_06450 [Phycisphaerae bacterium]|nr:hypothetical protein [Phycisphaerae bacterium]